MWSFDHSKIVNPTYVGFRHKMLVLLHCTIVISSLMILKLLNVGFAMQRSASGCCETILTSIRFLKSSHILPKTALLHNLYKFRSNSVVANFRFSVLKLM